MKYAADNDAVAQTRQIRLQTITAVLSSVRSLHGHNRNAQLLCTATEGLHKHTPDHARYMSKYRAQTRLPRMAPEQLTTHKGRVTSNPTEVRDSG